MDSSSPEILLTKRLENYTPEEYKTYINSLYIKPSDTLSNVAEVNLYFGKRTIVRVKRTPKYVTRKELIKLADDYGKPLELITELFEVRKIEIKD